MGAACFASGFYFADFAVDVGARVVDVSLLDDAGDVEHAVDSPVAAEFESMADRDAVALAR